ncbi:integrase core domain-containing protein [Burkholderia contaminans]|nr:integrase core domain-containing protein [Burkholderia contaminans]
MAIEFVESFNGKPHDEFPNRECFRRQAEANMSIERWRQPQNER